MIQDASLATALGVGSVVLSSAGGALSVQRLSPMTAATAREMVDVILTARKQARGTVAPSPGSDVMEQLKQLSELRDSGVLSVGEFEAKKTELLRRI
jgi:hypothetical protein